ncbi:SET domain-containing protein-lysine N-methyltransferase [Burkholderia sp. Ac-20365]|uniref:SET domain-containing protein-lysine N-methyltransferase n=1 Tax=Burkholderia sp. Ac-20365 TaxID=2703897 RepID=UPI00197B7FA1|nr:SET domain-containing protein-lysine N-methyltransferase [Burkholderia sp. Ac-20365]
MRRVVVRKSVIHGKGVFALTGLKAGERILEYKGEIIRWKSAMRRYRDSAETGHTFLFGLSDGRLIDGGRGGNSSRWLNHACNANCETIEIGEKVFIEATRDIAAGEELFIAYALSVDDCNAEETRRLYNCHCGAAECRGTMLAA